MKTTFTIGVAIAFATSSILVVSHAPAAEEERLGRGEALDTVRALNTAEVTEFMQYKAYAPLGRVIQNLKWKSDLSIKHITVPLESPSARVKDYEVSLNVSADAKYYLIQLTPTAAAPDCAPGWFSNPSGVIYSGPPLECLR